MEKGNFFKNKHKYDDVAAECGIWGIESYEGKSDSVRERPPEADLSIISKN